jgi:hypothetical protein
LEITAAAAREMGAGRLPTVGAGLEQLDDLAPAIAGLALRQPDTHPITRCRAGYEDRNALETPEALAAGDQLVDPQLELVDLGQA